MSLPYSVLNFIFILQRMFTFFFFSSFRLLSISLILFFCFCLSRSSYIISTLLLYVPFEVSVWCPSCPKLLRVVAEKSWKFSSSGWVLLIVHLITPSLYFSHCHGVSHSVCSAHCLLTEWVETPCKFLHFSFCAASFSPVLWHTN